MKRNILTIALLASAASAMAQYQLPNSNFESDFVEAYKKTPKWGSKTQYYEPLNWHGYATIDASTTNEAGRTGDKLKASDDVRTGSTGSKSVCIKATSILGIVANGVMTTGRIYTHSTNATEAASNYNFSDPSFDISSSENTASATVLKAQLLFPNNRSYAQPFTGKPDAFTAWVKYVPKNTSDNASVNAVIHTNARYQDPEATDYSAVKVAAAKNDAIAYNNGEWQQLDIPFDYSVGTGTTPAYILVTFTTNKTPGGGSDGDALYIDDIAMVYYSTLSTLTYDGTNILSGATTSTDGKTVSVDMSNTLYQAGKIAYTLKGVGASVLSEKYDDKTGVYTIQVAGNDNNNGSNVTTYNIQFLPVVNIEAGKTIETTAQKAKVVMTRDFKQGWNTVCLPFATTASALGATKVQQFSAGDDQSVTFAEVANGAIAANTPYLVFFNAAKSWTTASPFEAVVTLEATSPKSVTHGAFTFSGNYTAGKNMNGLYGVATVDGIQRLRKGNSSATLPAGCAYFTSTSANANGLAISFDGQTTGIANVDAATDAQTTGAVYNLQGVKVSTNGTAGLPAGLYIQGGRKVIVK